MYNYAIFQLNDIETDPDIFLSNDFNKIKEKFQKLIVENILKYAETQDEFLMQDLNIINDTFQKVNKFSDFDLFNYIDSMLNNFEDYIFTFENDRLVVYLFSKDMYFVLTKNIQEI